MRMELAVYSLYRGDSMVPRRRIPIALTIAGLCLVQPAMAAPEATFTGERICKAAIGTIMGRHPKIVKVTNSKDGIVYLNYVRPDDKSKWAFRCRLDGSRVIWASDPGRWRTDPRDEKVSYKIEGDTLTVTENYSNGTVATQESFRLKQLGP